MAFVKKDLQDDLEDLFKSMNDGDNSVFSNGIASLIVSYVATGAVSTNDAGTVSGGTYVGSGTGSLSVTTTACARIIKTACDNMTDTAHGNDYLAEQIGAGIKKMADDGVVTTTVTGTLTPPSGTPVTGYGGTATGTISCNASSLIFDLKTVFSQMWSNREQAGYDGNLEFAKKLASAVDSFWKNGQITTSGEGNIEGSTGSGTIA